MKVSKKLKYVFVGLILLPILLKLFGFLTVSWWVVIIPLLIFPLSVVVVFSSFLLFYGVKAILEYVEGLKK